MLTFLKTQGLLFISLAILAATAVLAVVPKPATFTGTDAYGILMVALGAVGVLAGGVLGSNTPNSALVPHLIFMVAAVGMCVALGLDHVFTSSQILGVFSTFLGGSAAGVGVSVVNSPTPVQVPTSAQAQSQTSHQN